MIRKEMLDTLLFVAIVVVVGLVMRADAGIIVMFVGWAVFFGVLKLGIRMLRARRAGF